MLSVILGYGLRRSEARGLDLSDIITDERTLLVLGVTNGAKLGLPQLRWIKIDETF